MAFTVKVFIPPAILFLICLLMQAQHPKTDSGLGFGAIALVWVWVAIPVVVLYWIVRLVKRATRDSPDPYGRH
jgi:threonine/homoserine/homoserine lactone efflux protein